MGRHFVETQLLAVAKARHPDAVRFVRVALGYWAFDTEVDYEVWLNERS